MPAAARRADGQHVACLEFNCPFGRESEFDSIPDEEIFPALAGPAACQPIRGVDAALGEQGYLAVGQNFDLANDAIPASELPVPARPSSDLVPADAERVGIFQRLDRGVQRIRHVRVDGGYAIRIGPRPRPTADGFVIRELPRRPR